MNFVIIVVYLLLVVGVLYCLGIWPEKFGVVNFTVVNGAEFRGINLLGDNSTDGHFAASSPQECQQVCARNKDCKGYGYYAPGQRCYMFMSGDFVPGRPGYYSGKRI